MPLRGRSAVQLPPQLHVFVRDWLSGNNVVLRSAEGHVVIDSGYAKHVPLTLALVASRQGLDGDTLAWVINTHCHSDHMGGNAALKRAYACRIALPAGEAPHVRDWDQRALLLADAGQRAERFDVDAELAPGTTARWGDLDWRLLAAPGHDMAALVFFNEANGILISGDALWADGFGFVMPSDMDPEALPATRATLDMIASLPVRVVIPGHGEPFAGHGLALERAYRRLEAFEAEPARLARHAAKVLVTFALLDRERMTGEALRDFVARVPLVRELNERHLRRTPDDLARWLAEELCRAGAATLNGGELMSRARA
jgi:glyoxylase-like metal-dependent hydrolase (beta-lactamase superfamily II)